MTKQNQNPALRMDRRQSPPVVGSLHPAWTAFIRHCRELGFGEISQLKIQDGVPVMAEETTRKVKFV
jgi:hypothetical protein